MGFRKDRLWRSHWVVWVGLFGLSTLFQLLGWIDWLRFDRSLLDSGHLWLLFSSQLVHLNWPHWGLNMAGLSIVALLFGRYGSPLYWLWIVAVSALAVGCGLWLLNPELRWYVGLSGALHGLILAGILREFRINRVAGGLLLSLIAAKLAWEQFAGAMPGSGQLIGGRVVVDSHLYGAAGGVLAFALWFLLGKATHRLPTVSEGEKRSG